MKIISGQFGLARAIFAVLFYTVFTMAGSIYAHYRSLRKEKGATAVGASKRYAQIPVEEWEQVKALAFKVPYNSIEKKAMMRRAA